MLAHSVPGRSRAAATVRLTPILVMLPLLLAAHLCAQQQGREPALSAAPGVDPAFVNLLIAHQHQAMHRLTAYCFKQHWVYEKLGDGDHVERRETKIEMMCYDDGAPRSRLLVLNGKPTGLKADDPWPPAVKDEDWRRRKREAAERTSRFQEIINEIPQAFLFTEARRDTMDGRATTVYRLTPNPAYDPRTRTAEMLRHVSGIVWVDVKAVQMVRLLATVDSDFDLWGGLALKVRRGGSFEMRQRPYRGVWLPYFSDERWRARIALFKQVAQHQRVERSDVAPAAEVLAGKK